jgi:hypothetical protein
VDRDRGHRWGAFSGDRSGVRLTTPPLFSTTGTVAGPPSPGSTFLASNITT